MSRPNILLITSDQHNAEILGCAGNPVVRTPNIDALAAEGLTFAQAFTSYPLCTPARTTIFTGRYPSRHGVCHNVNMGDKPSPPGLAPAHVAFPELLAAAGYHTALLGKLHARHEGGRNFGLQTVRLVEGKGHFVGSPDGEDDYRRYLSACGYREDIWRTWKLPDYPRHGCVTSPLPEKDYIDTFVADLALEHLAHVPEPFFCWASFCNPHTPLDPPRPYDTMYDPSAIPPPHRRQGELETKPRRWVDQVARTIPALPLGSTDPSLPGGAENAYRRFPEDATRRMLAAYYGEVTHLDTQVGRLVEALRRRGICDNTVIIFTSDHGDYCGNNWAFYKHAGLYDSLIRVPLIIRWPGATAPPGRVDALVSLVDIAPSILDAADVPVPVPGGLDGRSLPWLAGPMLGWRAALGVENGATNAVLTREWKLVRWRDGTEELYDRLNDPHDLCNVAGQPALQRIQSRLRRRLVAWEQPAKGGTP